MKIVRTMLQVVEKGARTVLFLITPFEMTCFMDIPQTAAVYSCPGCNRATDNLQSPPDLEKSGNHPP